MTEPIKLTIKTEFTPTPYELANIFQSMSSEEQALFFSSLAILVGNWEKPFEFQLEYISQDNELTKEGRNIMEQIGQYAHHNKT